MTEESEKPKPTSSQESSKPSASSQESPPAQSSGLSPQQEPKEKIIYVQKPYRKLNTEFWEKKAARNVKTVHATSGPRKSKNRPLDNEPKPPSPKPEPKEKEKPKKKSWLPWED